MERKFQGLMSRRRQPGKRASRGEGWGRGLKGVHIDYLTPHICSPEILKYQSGQEGGRRGGYYRRKGKNSTEELSGAGGERQEAIW